MPNMYARGILWGKMFLELGDSCMAKNEQTGHYADIQFKTKVIALPSSRLSIVRLDSVRALQGILLRNIQRYIGPDTPGQQ